MAGNLFGFKSRRAATGNVSVRRRPARRPAGRFERLEQRALLATFDAGNLVVFQAASATLNNTTGTMLEISPTLTSQTTAVRSYAYGAGIRFSGSASSTGYVSRSADGTLVTVTGAQSDNTSNNANTLTTRAVLALDANPANTTFAVATTYTGTSGRQTRSATTLDGSTWVIGDQAGIYTNNATAPSPTGNIRNVRPFGGTIYVGQASTSLAPVSTLSAATGGTIAGLPGLAVGTSAVTDFYLVQSGSNGSAFDVLYVTSATSGTAGTVAKHSLVNGTWVSNGSYTTNFGGFGLAALDRDATNVTPGSLLFVTSGNGATATNTVRRLVDAGGFNEAINVTTVDTLFTAATGTTLKGIDFAPSSVVASPSVAVTPTSTAVASSSATLGGDVTATGGSPITERGVVYALTSVNATPEIDASGVVKVAAGTAATGVFTVGVTGLAGASGYSFRAYATNSVDTTYSDVGTFTTTSSATAPAVASPTAVGITDVSATLGGSVTGDGDSPIIERGIMLAETAVNGNPEDGGFGVTKLTAAGTTGTFTLEATGLTTLTGYSYKAFATNAIGTTYTDVATFTTITTPTVSFPTQTSISYDAATLGGTVDSAGGGTVTERGVVYSLTTVNADPVIGGAGVTKLAAGSGGVSPFTTRATGLQAGASYTFKAYATNAAGTTYTVVDTFNTVAAPIVQWTFEGDVTTPAVGSGTASLVGGTTASFASGNPGRAWNVTTFAAQGTGSGTRGTQFLASTVGRENISFSLDIRATGTASRWSQVDYTLDGGANWVTGFWNNAGGLSPDSVFVSSTIDFSSITAANNNPGFGVRVVSIFSPLAFNQNTTLAYDANAAYMRANSSATYAGTPPGASTSDYATTGLWRFDNVTLTGDPLPAELATVTTPTSASVTTSAATLGGNVTSDGFATVIERGVVYALTSENTNPEIGGTGVVKVAAAAGGTGVFTVEATGLTASSGYTFRAYAINSAGPAYSSTDTFTTLGQAAAPSVALGSPASSGITTTAASLLADVTSDGGDAITERGFVFSVTATNGDPIIDGTGVTKVAVAGTTGGLTTDLTGLDPAAGYSFKAFATNTQGTTYTSVATFATLAPTTIELTGLSPLTTVTGQTVSFSGTVTATAGTATPAGTVQIRVGGPTGTLLASTTTIGGSDVNGTFSIETTSVPIGTYSGIQAFFVPGSGFAGSSSTAFGGTLEVGIAPFTPGNLLVLRVGDGTNTLGSVAAAVSLLELTTAGAIVQTIPVTSAGEAALTLRGNSTTEGILTISGDRKSVTFGGYRADALTADPSGTSASRVIGRVDGVGTVNTAQAITGSFLNDSFRSVATDDGTNFWLSGAGDSLSGGVRYAAGPTATTAAVLSDLSNTRQVAVLDGNLFASAGGGFPSSGAFQIGLGLPTEEPQTLASAGLPTSSNQYQSFYYADLDPTASWQNTGYDTLYVTNSRSGGLALRKFSFVDTAGVGSWADSGSISLIGASNVAGFTSGSNVTLYVTTSTSNAGAVQTLTDATGYNGNFGSLTLSNLTSPVTAGTNYAFRGLAFVPRSGVATTTTVTAVTPTTVEQGQPVTFTATVTAASGSDTPTGSVQFRSGTTVLATAALTGTGATSTATIQTSSIPFGTYANITAQYVPDGNPSLNLFNPSTSAPFGTSLVVEQPGVVTTTTLVTVSPTTVAYGEAVTFTGAVTTADSSSPSGTLEIRSGGPTGLLLGSTTTFEAGGSYTVVTSTPIPGGVYGDIAAHFVSATGFKNSSSTAFGQSLTVTSTQLTAGGIAFTGFKATNPDKMSFVLLADVIAGTQIVITDNAWTGTALTGNEGSTTITFTQPFQAGTVFDYESVRETGQKWQHGGNSFAGGSAVGISDVTTSSFGLNASGDNLFAYQGAPPTSGTSQGWIAAFSSLRFLTEGLTNSSTTYLPAALTIGDTAFSLNLDPAALLQDGGINDLGNLTNTAAGIRGTVYTPANWTAFTADASVDIPSPTQFTIGSSATPAIGTTGNFTALVTPAGTASTATTITVAGSNLTEAITATAPAGFEVSSDGSTYGPTATFTPASGVASGTLSLRLAAATAVGSYSGSVSLASAGATTVEVPVPAGVVTSPPVKVTGVFVRGGTWNAGYLGLSEFTTVGTDQLGWGLRDGANQLATSGVNAAQVTWTNVNRLSVRFNQPIATPAVDALKLLKGESGGDVTITPTGVTMLAGNTVAQFSFDAAFETGQYVAAIAAGGIFDAAGTTVLDGEWTNGSSTFAAGSGDGTEGGSFDYRFNVLAGDVNTSGGITNTDRAVVVAQLFQSLGSANYRANLDGSATITNTDVVLVSAKLFQSLGTLPNTPVATAPAVTAATFAAVTATTAELGGRVASSGGSTVTERGIVLLAGASGTPAIGGPGVIELLAAGTLGTFSVAAENLAPSTTYRFRAFARNALGISYSEIRSLTTPVVG